MFLRMIRGEEKSHATKKKKALKHCVSRLSVRETGLEIVVVWFSSLLHIPRSFYINAFSFLDIPRFSYPIPNGEGFLRDFGTLINPIALAIFRVSYPRTNSKTGNPWRIAGRNYWWKLAFPNNRSVINPYSIRAQSNMGQFGKTSKNANYIHNYIQTAFNFGLFARRGAIIPHRGDKRLFLDHQLGIPLQGISWYAPSLRHANCTPFLLNYHENGIWA